MLLIKQEVLDIVSSRYEILEVIDLSLFDYQLNELSLVLSKYKNYEFFHNQRLVILHHDTDYYINEHTPGFLLYNLCVLLNQYQIPHEFLILFTNHYGVKKEITELSNHICNADPFKVVYTSQWYDYSDDASTSDHITPVENLFCCLNGVSRIHRILTLCYLKEFNLLDKGSVSYHFR